MFASFVTDSQPLWYLWCFVLSLAMFFHQKLDKPHYWALACFFTLNWWCERCTTFSQLPLQMEIAWGYFSPLPHEWTCQLMLAPGLWVLCVRLMTPMIIKLIFFCVTYFPCFLFFFFFKTYSMIFILLYSISVLFLRSALDYSGYNLWYICIVINMTSKQLNHSGNYYYSMLYDKCVVFFLFISCICCIFWLCINILIILYKKKSAMHSYTDIGISISIGALL